MGFYDRTESDILLFLILYNLWFVRNTDLQHSLQLLFLLYGWAMTIPNCHEF